MFWPDAFPTDCRTGWSHPFLQTIFSEWLMHLFLPILPTFWTRRPIRFTAVFCGEMLCLVAFAFFWFRTAPEKRDPIKEGFRPWILAVSN